MPMQSLNRVRFWWADDPGCYDLEVRDPEATVADYERAVGELLAEPDALRKYSESCIGCCLCCGGRLPLTVVDLYRLKMGGMGMALPLNDWVATYGVMQRQGKCVDIALRLDEFETCALWDREAGLCRVYGSRPLICRTYTCATLSWRAAELRAEIVNVGEDELISMLGLSDESDRAGKRQPFSGVLDYGGVLLRDVCSDRLWQRLTNHARG